MIALSTIYDTVYNYLNALAGAPFDTFQAKWKREFLPVDHEQFFPAWLLRPPSCELIREEPTLQDIWIVSFDLIIIGPQNLDKDSSANDALDLVDAIHAKIHGNAFTNTFDHYHALVRSINFMGRELEFEPNVIVAAYHMEWEGQLKGTHNFVP